MLPVDDTDISTAIIDAYHAQLRSAVRCDVLIAGAGPSGLAAAYHLGRAGLHVVVVEKRLSAGGGVWGGAMGMNLVVVQEDALAILEEMGIRHRPGAHGLNLVVAAELASGLTLSALRTGRTTLLNLTYVEDVAIRDQRAIGLVVNRTGVADTLPVDPITLHARAVIDATGHDAAVVGMLARRGLVADLPALARHREAPMDAAAGEAFTVDHVAQVFPGLWITGMSVCAALGGPRMGPIFGGMILSGQRVAELVLQELGSRTSPPPLQDNQRPTKESVGVARG